MSKKEARITSQPPLLKTKTLTMKKFTFSFCKCNVAI